MSYKNIYRPLSHHEGQDWLYRSKSLFLPDCKHVFFCCKVGHFNMGVYGIDSFLEPVSRGQSMNCSLSHFRVGFKRKK